MSFLSELKKQKEKLKETETVVTNADGKRFVEKHDGVQNLSPNAYGFVVDTKPDDTPALVDDYVYIGSQDCTEDRVLKSYNIKHVLSLGVNVNVANVNHMFIECLDLPETDLKPVLRAALPFIESAVRSRERVLVQCNAGVSRAAAVCAAHVMRARRLPYHRVYLRLKDARPAVQPNPGFRAQLIRMTDDDFLQSI